MMAVGQTLSLLVLTLLSYWAGCRLHRRVPHVLMSPVFTSTLLVIGALCLTHTDYQTYQVANKPLSWLLGPAQVAMALPLFKGWTLLKKHFSSVLTVVFAGTGSGVLTAALAGKLLHLSSETTLSLIPKSATTPIAMVTSQSLGGTPELAAIFAVLTGILGVAAGPVFLRWMGVQSRLLKGLALGTAGQMLGAARASKWGDAAAAMGIVGMSLTAMLIGLVTPYLVPILL
jgi:putative effector of murein hydrolase